MLMCIVCVFTETVGSPLASRGMLNGSLSASSKDLQWRSTPPSQPVPSNSSASTSKNRIRDDGDMR